MKISVIIPIFNEKLTIIELLKKVNQEKKRYNIEIIVSDDGSNDGTLEFLFNNSISDSSLIEFPFIISNSFTLNLT